MHVFFVLLQLSEARQLDHHLELSNICFHQLIFLKACAAKSNSFVREDACCVFYKIKLFSIVQSRYFGNFVVTVCNLCVQT